MSCPDLAMLEGRRWPPNMRHVADSRIDGDVCPDLRRLRARQPRRALGELGVLDDRTLCALATTHRPVGRSSAGGVIAETIAGFDLAPISAPGLELLGPRFGSPDARIQIADCSSCKRVTQRIVERCPSRIGGDA